MSHKSEDKGATIQKNTNLGQKVRVLSVGKGFNGMRAASLNMTWSRGALSLPSL